MCSRALRCTYKLIFNQNLKEIREWRLFTEREGLMQMGIISKFFGPYPCSFYGTLLTKQQEAQSKL